MQQKILAMLDKVSSFHKDHKVVIPMILAAISSVFIGGYFGGVLYILTNESATQIAEITLLDGPKYVFTSNGFMCTMICMGIWVAAGVILIFKNPDLDKADHTDERGVTISKDGTYGTADFLPHEKAHESFEVAAAKDAEGIILGEVKVYGKNQVVCLPNNAPGNRNILIFGSPGSGKSYGFVRSAVFQSIKNQASIVVTDPKGEIHADMRDVLEKNGYTVKVVNFVDLAYSDAWDCAAEIINPVTGDVDELRVAEFSDAIMKNSGEGDEFWDSGEANLFKAIIYYVVYQHNEELKRQCVRSITKYAKQLNVGGDDLQALIDVIDGSELTVNDKLDCVKDVVRMSIMYLENDRAKADEAAEHEVQSIIDFVDQSSPLRIDYMYQLLITTNLQEWENYFKTVPLDHPAAMAWAIFRQASDNSRPQFVIGLAQRLQLFQMQDLRRILRNKDIDLASLGDLPDQRKTALFCIISDKSAAMKPITSLLFNFLFKDISDAADRLGSKNRNTVNMIMDEFVNIGMIPNFQTFISTVRSRNIGVFMILQTYSQLQETYGETNAETIIGCCDTLLCLGVNDKTTAEFISWRMGVATIRATSIKDSREGSIGFRGINQGYSLSDGDGKRNLMNPDELINMPFEKVIIMKSHSPGVLQATKFPYTKHPMFKQYAVTDEHGKKRLQITPYYSLPTAKEKYAATEDRDCFITKIKGKNAASTMGDVQKTHEENEKAVAEQAKNQFVRDQTTSSKNKSAASGTANRFGCG